MKRNSYSLAQSSSGVRRRAPLRSASKVPDGLMPCVGPPLHIAQRSYRIDLGEISRAPSSVPHSELGALSAYLRELPLRTA